MRQPQGGTISSTAQAGPLLRRGARGQGWQTHVRLADMCVGTCIADLMFDTASQRPHGRGRRFQEQVIGIIIRHGNSLAVTRLADWRFGQVNAKTPLVIFRHGGALNLITFIQKAQPECCCDITENLRVFSPGNYRPR